MQKSLLILIVFVSVALTTCSVAQESNSSSPKISATEILFVRHVRPMLREKCLACHGSEPTKLEGSLDMRSLKGLLAGGDSGEPSIVVGKPDQSPLVLAAKRASDDWSPMPPKESEQLTPEEVNWIRQWIANNAPWPDAGRIKLIEAKYAEGEQVATSKALSEQWQNRRYEPGKLWAYRPLAVTGVPAGENPIDWFIDQKLSKSKLKPAPSALAEKLARRMSFGLTGLPPKPIDVKKFKSAYATDQTGAVNQYAKRLMATKSYGEHFGLHWLDVARYADSAGFANDYCRPNAWRYRDYVVRSFNEDKRYSDFVREQIAGDEMDADDSEHLIATGFLRMGPWEQTSMSVFKETRQQWLDDVTDSVGQVFLGHAMQCAKCHDHKFDPVPTRDYYSMMAVFSTTQFAERDAPFLKSENKTGFKPFHELVKAKIEAYAAQQKSLESKVKVARTEETGDAKVGDNGLNPGDEASLSRMKKNIMRHNLEYDRTRPIALSVFTGNNSNTKNVSRRIPLPKNLWNKNKLEPDTIYSGGSVYATGDQVKPGALSAANSLAKLEPFEFPSGKGKRRLALANWIVSPKNPLTARVMVNRVWSWHFGKGLAANPNNVGGTGGLPTHPELLDFLAGWFMKSDWSVKALNELIISSEAYRRSSVHPNPQLENKLDPNGDLYASFLPRRLTAEELRDAMLFVSGELNRQVGGIPCRPDINIEVAFQPRQIMGGTASVYEPDPTPNQRNRRSLYAEKLRGIRDPFLESFNQPGPDKSCELRETSTVAPQALTLFNSEEVLDRAYGLAIRLVAEDAARDGRATIVRAFQLALGRNANNDELKACLEHWKQATEEESNRKYESKSFKDKIERTVMAEKTGEPYSFEEFLPAYTDYQPDVEPGKLDAKTRGLAQVCLVLFNLNEFAYLD